MRKTILMASLGLLLNFTPAFALIPNGDFETGDLAGYSVQEDLVDVLSSSLVKNVDDGTGNRVGEIKTGYTSTGVATTSLIRDLGTLPEDVQDLFFDVQFSIVAEDSRFFIPGTNEFQPYGGIQRDFLNVSLETSSGQKKFILGLDNGSYSLGSGGQIDILPNGFLQIKTNIAGFGGTNSKLSFDLQDQNNEFSSRIYVDNIDFTAKNQAVAPEPASMLLIGGGLMGFGFLRKKKLV